ncbi:MAG: SOS response-associated peptidase [Granulosicoccus sp.]
MCGRVNVSDNEGVRQLLEAMGMETWPSREPRFNVAPTQVLDVVAMQQQAPKLQPMSWGVSITVNGKKGQITRRVQNSRSDKIWTSRMWKPLISCNRVLVPINGFYEWRRRNKKVEAVFHITPTRLRAMFLAGIYRNTATPAGEPEVSIVTTEANESMAPIHDRMPVILASRNAAMAWLQDDDRESLNELMQPANNESLIFTQVGDYVNKSSNEGHECIEPLVA